MTEAAAKACKKPEQPSISDPTHYSRHGGIARSTQTIAFAAPRRAGRGAQSEPDLAKLQGDGEAAGVAAELSGRLSGNSRHLGAAQDMIICGINSGALSLCTLGRPWGPAGADEGVRRCSTRAEVVRAADRTWLTVRLVELHAVCISLGVKNPGEASTANFRNCPS